MYSKTRGIILHAMPYNDKYAIIYMYTEQFGRSSYMVARSRGKRSSVTKALFMPLSVLDLEVEHKAHRDIHRIREAKLCFPLTDIFCNPVKNVLTLFLAEILFRVVKETEPDRKLFSFLSDSIQLLELSETGVANFHIVFLLHLLRYLGISPNSDGYKANSFFDMLNGVFTDVQPLHKYYFTPEESIIFKRLLEMSYDNMNMYSFSRQERVRIISRLLDYYRLHLPDFPNIKSLSVLQDLFN